MPRTLDPGLLLRRLYDGGGVQYADLSSRDVWAFKDNVAETRARKRWYSTLVSSLPSDDGAFSFTSAAPSVLSRPLKVSEWFERTVQRLVSKTAVSDKWRRLGHINLLDTEALLLAVRHMASSACSCGHRVIAFVDSTAALGAVAKGRSSASSLNTTSRKVTSVLLKEQITIFAHSVPSSLNLADTPSRAFENVTPGRSVA